MTSQQPIAVVTGASRGIGRAVALELVGNGYRVFALARSGLDLEDLASLVPEGEIAAVVADVADDESREAAVDLIMDATGGYGTDVLV
ncbi:MAG TPA: SDR family NAD(P)-dependent oxidoreductase, partial [Chloroflexota bacterium]